jgi:hypothetical protein
VTGQFFIEIIHKSIYASVLWELMGFSPVILGMSEPVGIRLFNVLLMNRIKL